MGHCVCVCEVFCVVRGSLEVQEFNRSRVLNVEKVLGRKVQGLKAAKSLRRVFSNCLES